MSISASRVTITQILILQQLAQAKPGERVKAGPTMAAVTTAVHKAGLVQTGRGGYGHMLDRMTERGWITQSPAPQRGRYRMQGQIRLTITPAGVAALVSIERILGAG